MSTANAYNGVTEPVYFLYSILDFSTFYGYVTTRTPRCILQVGYKYASDTSRATTDPSSENSQLGQFVEVLVHRGNQGGMCFDISFLRKVNINLCKLH